MVDWCCRLIMAEEREDDPHLGWLGGSEDWLPYWRRVWGTRGLLYAWDTGSTERVTRALASAMADEHWRVREMACKVVKARNLHDLAEPTAGLLSDSHPRVRSAATRASISLSA